MKRILTIALTCAMALTLLVGCGKKDDAKVDLASFSQSVQSEHEFGFLETVTENELIETIYPGLTDIETNQSIVNACMVTNNMGEFALVEVKNSDDVGAVKMILQSRINNMVEGGAFYPEATEMWKQNSTVVDNGNYVMMVVHEDKDAIVDAFNALFK